MRLFDLAPQEKKALKKFMAWHLGYIGYVGIFSFFLYYFHLFKAYWFFRESWILNLLAPLHTLVFITVSPYRRHWVTSITNMYKTLDGEPVFCLMALLIFFVGFYLYNGLIWGLGSLLPSIFFT
ncbi:MAG: hypothetical protein HQK55_10425 [Deltaproteobacteria bacterium]|nr:hypothetical protein [Deltaproteobacteria bacterium]